MKGPNIYRQGDVLLRRVRTIPEGSKPVPRDAERIVLAYGETTGHAHAIANRNAELLELAGPQLERRFLRVLAEGGVSTVDLVHEEHSTITLPAGDYEVVRQREYTPWGERQVTD